MSRTGTADMSIPTQRPPVATAIAVLAVLGAVGSIVMVALHVSLDMPAVAAGFAVGAVAYAAIAYGAWRRLAWIWPAALVVNAMALASTVLPWRGLERSGLPALVSIVAIALLVSRPGRDALLYRR